MAENQAVNRCSSDRHLPGPEFEPLREAVVVLFDHIVHMRATFGEAMTAGLEARHRAVTIELDAFERWSRHRIQDLTRDLERAHEYWVYDTEGRHAALDALAGVVAELNRRNKRSGAKPSPELKRAAKLVADHVSELEDAAE